MGDEDRSRESLPRETDGPSWSVWRQDDHGNVFPVQGGLTETQALRLVRDLESRGHKQTYWAKRDE